MAFKYLVKSEQIKEHKTELIDPSVDPTQLKFLLAVSGGMDSMVLAHCFLTLEIDFGIVHFNFQLRGEASDLDEQLVREFCKENGIPYHVRSENAEHIAQRENLSIQETARNLRYDFFDKVMDHNQYDYVCTAHHGNDQLETFFIHLFRGSGLKGLTGIPQKRDRILRPMLWTPHHELEQYTAQFSIKYRDDSSNRSDKYLRNQIRHHIIEPLTDKNPIYLSKSLDSIHLLNEYQGYIGIQLSEFRKKHVDKLAESIERIYLHDEIIQSPANLFLLKLYLFEQGLYPDSIRDFINTSGDWRTGSMYEGNSVNAWYDRDRLWVIKDSFYNNWGKIDVIEITPESTSSKLPGGDQVEFLTTLPDNQSTGEWIIPVNQNKVTLPLRMRHRQPGDYIELGTPPYF